MHLGQKQKIVRGVILVAVLAFLAWLVLFLNKPTLEETLTTADQQLQTRDYQAAEGTLKEYLPYVDSAMEERRVRQNLAAIYISWEKPHEALEQYQEIVNIDENAEKELAIAIAQTAEELKDNETAIKYYQIALENLNPEDVLYEADKQSLERKIKALKDE